MADHTIDLRKISGGGRFLCPKCKSAIDPDDDTELNYTIIDSEMTNDEISSMTVKCLHCETTIKLTGFPGGSHP